MCSDLWFGITANHSVPHRAFDEDMQMIALHSRDDYGIIGVTTAMR